MSNKQVKVNVKTSDLGGVRTPLKLKYATQRLLKVLWEKHGGVRELERVTGISAQHFIHWRNKGKVSYKYIGRVSRALKLPLRALDFVGIEELLGKSLSWKDILVRVHLSPSQLTYICKGLPPE